MGQKINPILFRIGNNKLWNSSYYYHFPYSNSLLIDLKIRKYLYNYFIAYNYFCDNIIIKKYNYNKSTYISCNIIYSLINSSNLDKNKIIKDLQHITKYNNVFIDFNIAPTFYSLPIYNALLLSKYIAKLIEKRINLKKVLLTLKNVDLLKGYKIKISGRLNGASIARNKIYKQGTLPLQSINKSIDYGYTFAYTKYGIIGVKVWLYF